MKDREFSFGFRIRGRFGLLFPKDQQVYNEEYLPILIARRWFVSKMTQINLAHHTCGQFVLAEKRAARMGRLIVQAPQFFFQKFLADFTKNYGGNLEELSRMKPMNFFVHAGRTILTQGLISLIDDRKELTPSTQFQITLNSIKAEVEKRLESPSLARDIRGVLIWFNNTGFEQALEAAKKQKHES